MIRKIPRQYRRDRRGEYFLRVYLPGFEELDPLALPWQEMRRNPEKFPQYDMTKIQSSRTVAGLEFETSSGDTRWIYLKRSFVKGLKKQVGDRFRGSKEWREMLLAEKFHRRGVVVPMPVFYAETICEGHPTRFFATLALGEEWKEAKHWLRKIDDPIPDWKRIAGFTRWLHDRKMLHGDYRSDHIYLNVTEADSPTPNRQAALIDLDGSRVGRTVNRKERVSALRQLAESVLPGGFGREEMAIFLEVYDPDGEFCLTVEETHDWAAQRRAERRRAI